MVVTDYITILSADRLTEIGQAFFAAQKTGETWVCESSIDDLAATILDRRHRLRDVVVAAPGASFEAQLDDEQGKTVWSAGQCVDHTVNTQYGVCETAIIAFMTSGELDSFEQPLPADEIPEPPLLSRDAALARLDASTPDYERLLDGVPRDADLTTTLEHRYFGTINLMAILLISAWHEQLHAAQIESLAT